MLMPLAIRPHPFRKLPIGPGNLKDFQVDDKGQAGLVVEVARRPLRPNGFKADFANVFVAMLLPEGAAVWMSIQRLLKLHDRLVKRSKAGAAGGRAFAGGRAMRAQMARSKTRERTLFARAIASRTRQSPVVHVALAIN